MITPLAASLPATVPFVGPETLERRRNKRFIARLGANESAFGPSPQVIAAMQAGSREVWQYCDPESYELKTQIATHCGVAIDNICLGEGIDGLLGLTVRLFANPNDPVVTSLGAYPTFNYHVAGFGARLITVAYTDDREDIDALATTARRENASLVYFSNPDNPMGTWWPQQQVQQFIDALPETTLLILDEAYGETAPNGTLPPIDIARPNVLRLRTFSKAYGLAGLRCGYAIGEAETINAFNKVRNHFGVNKMAQLAAQAALADQNYLTDVVEKVSAGRQRIAAIAAANGLMPITSATNFVTIDCGQDAAYAERVLRRLEQHDIFIRKPMAPGLDRCIRVSVGLDAELDRFEQALPAALQ